MADSAPKSNGERGFNPKRIATALSMAGVVLAVMAADHWMRSNIGFFALWGLVVSLALVEFFGMAARAGNRPYVATGVLAGTALALFWYPVPGHPAHVDNLFWIACAVVFITLPIDMVREQKASSTGGPVPPLRSLLITLGGITCIGFLGSFLTRIRLLHIGAEIWQSEALLLLIVAIAKCGDSAAYFTGRAFGRHKLAPSISPGKTREGAAGGLAASIGVAALGSAWIPADTFLPLGPALLFGLLVGVASQLGDLAESWYKRSMGAKDSSGLLPHYGGILDLTDALFFAMPVAYCLLLILRP